MALEERDVAGDLSIEMLLGAAPRPAAGRPRSEAGVALAEAIAGAALGAEGGLRVPPAELHQFFFGVDAETATDCCLCFLARRQLDVVARLVRALQRSAPDVAPLVALQVNAKAQLMLGGAIVFS